MRCGRCSVVVTTRCDSDTVVVTWMIDKLRNIETPGPLTLHWCCCCRPRRRCPRLHPPSQTRRLRSLRSHIAHRKQTWRFISTAMDTERSSLPEGQRPLTYQTFRRYGVEACLEAAGSADVAAGHDDGFLEGGGLVTLAGCCCCCRLGDEGGPAGTA